MTRKTMTSTPTMSPDRRIADRRLGGAAAEAGSVAASRSGSSVVGGSIGPAYGLDTVVGPRPRTSGSVFLAECRQPVGRRDDVIRAGDRSGHARELVGRLGPPTDHAFEHLPERVLAATEPDEDRPVVRHGPVGDVP